MSLFTKGGSTNTKSAAALAVQAAKNRVDAAITVNKVRRDAARADEFSKLNTAIHKANRESVEHDRLVSNQKKLHAAAAELTENENKKKRKMMTADRADELESIKSIHAAEQFRLTDQGWVESDKSKKQRSTPQPSGQEKDDKKVCSPEEIEVKRADFKVKKAKLIEERKLKAQQDKTERLLKEEQDKTERKLKEQVRLTELFNKNYSKLEDINYHTAHSNHRAEMVIEFVSLTEILENGGDLEWTDLELMAVADLRARHQWCKTNMPEEYWSEDESETEDEDEDENEVIPMTQAM